MNYKDILKSKSYSQCCCGKRKESLEFELFFFCQQIILSLQVLYNRTGLCICNPLRLYR